MWNEYEIFCKVVKFWQWLKLYQTKYQLHTVRHFQTLSNVLHNSWIHSIISKSVIAYRSQPLAGWSPGDQPQVSSRCEWVNKTWQVDTKTTFHYLTDHSSWPILVAWKYLWEWVKRFNSQLILKLWMNAYFEWMHALFSVAVTSYDYIIWQQSTLYVHAITLMTTALLIYS